MPKGKNVLAIMLGGKPPKKKKSRLSPREEMEEPEEVEEESDYGEAFEESAEEVLSAINSGDTEAFASALKDAIVTCVEDQERGEY